MKMHYEMNRWIERTTYFVGEILDECCWIAGTVFFWTDVAGLDWAIIIPRVHVHMCRCTTVRQVSVTQRARIINGETLTTM
jgi:hypothetical protein